jgi:septum formation protein
MKNDKIILASASPRRAELLDMFEVDFEIFSVNIDETPLKNEQPEVYVKRVAENKVFEAGKKRKGIIIGADTIVWKEGFLGKPKNKDEAKNMLRKLSASSHFVYSAVAIMNTNTDKIVKSYLSKTMVVFHELSEEEIGLYIKTGEPMDKAGAYGIQGKGGVFIKEIQGSYYNVVGFPIDLVYRLLKDFGIELLKQS